MVRFRTSLDGYVNFGPFSYRHCRIHESVCNGESVKLFLGHDWFGKLFVITQIIKVKFFCKRSFTSVKIKVNNVKNICKPYICTQEIEIVEITKNDG